MYVDGHGATQSDTKAIEWSKKSAEQGYEPAKQVLSYLQ